MKNNITLLNTSVEKNHLLILRKKMEDFERKCNRLLKNTESWTVDEEDIRVALLRYVLIENPPKLRISLREYDSLEYLSYLPFFWVQEDDIWDVSFLHFLAWMCDINRVQEDYMMQSEIEETEVKKDFYRWLSGVLETYWDSIKQFYQEMTKPDLYISTHE